MSILGCPGLLVDVLAYDSAMAGRKQVDVLIPLNTERDATLIEYIHHERSGISLHNGDLIALEVETSDPTKTAPNNSLKNIEAGISLTLIAVLPKHLSPTRRALAALSPSVQDHTLLVDVLELLAILARG